jgi:CheY-like chemotaxis protein
MSYFKDFIIIDDDSINNKLCRKIIEKTYPESTIMDFTDPQEGFDHIVSKYSKKGTELKAILLLDISMPVMNAWEFLELFEKLDEDIKTRIKIHILSSSVNKEDMARAQSNKNVEYYLIKPLTKESIRLIVHVLNKRLGITTE